MKANPDHFDDAPQDRVDPLNTDSADPRLQASSTSIPLSELKLSPEVDAVVTVRREYRERSRAASFGVY